MALGLRSAKLRPYRLRAIWSATRKSCPSSASTLLAKPSASAQGEVEGEARDEHQLDRCIRMPHLTTGGGPSRSLPPAIALLLSQSVSSPRRSSAILYLRPFRTR
jgi:hypothetical protein